MARAALTLLATVVRRHLNRLLMPFTSVGASLNHASYLPSSLTARRRDHSGEVIPDLKRYLHSEREARELFESWCRKYRKMYSSEQQKLYRFSVFMEKLKRSVREGELTVHADQTPAERNIKRVEGISYPSVVVASASPNNPNGYFHSEEQAREHFETWCKEYHKTYNSQQEKIYRFNVFKENLEWCTRENKNCRVRCFGPNCHADLTLDEASELVGAGPSRPLSFY